MKQEMYRGQFADEARADMWNRVDAADRARQAAKVQRVMFQEIKRIIAEVEHD